MSRFGQVARNFSDILGIIRKIQYANVLCEGKEIRELSLLPLGFKLLDNIRREYINCDPVVNIYHSSEENKVESSNFIQNPIEYFKSDSFREQFSKLKEEYQAEIPLAMSECTLIPSYQIKPQNPEETLSVSVNSARFLSCSYFISPVKAIEEFSRIQRQRKIWWMKYAANPGRYKFSESVLTEFPEGKVQRVSVQSSIKDFFLDLESVELIKLKPGREFQLRDPRSGKEVSPAIVRTGICLDVATLGVLIDAVDSSDETESLLLHRKISPHQLAIFCYPERVENLSDLQDLARLITINTRKVGISTLNLPKCSTLDGETFSRELLQMDQLGTPYCIILDDESLRSGLLRLRSRDTTLSETIHLTDIPRYLQKIFSSF